MSSGRKIEQVVKAAGVVVRDEGAGTITGHHGEELEIGRVRAREAKREIELYGEPEIIEGRHLHVAPDADVVAFWLRGRKVYPYNKVDLLIDGEQTFPAMLEAMAEAKRSIVFESYIFASDATGQRFLDVLIARARADVSVRIMVDGVGSWATDPNFWKPLIEAGGRVEYYQPIQPWRRRWGIWRRNHRKILVIDDVVGFIGGINIGDDYAPTSWGGKAWHDVHARVEGPVVRELVRLFNRGWRNMTGEHWNGSIAHAQRRGSTTLQVLESALTRRYSVRRAYLRAIRKASRTIRICNAYCIPDRHFRHALRDAVRRGVTVQLLVAGKTDVVAVRYASRALYARLMAWGIEVYEWTDRVLHAKTAVIDGEWCTIGSYNIDARSLLHNLEANIACVDKRLGAAMDQTFERDIAKSVRIDRATWHRRPIAEKIVESIFFALRILL
ncbi:MAG: phosphatidylserine/phosphatidylglycerophosphate/cardiolipin synthase family protein [Myxococcota bacterium]